MISCIIPTYKDEDCLWRCFNSLKQSAERCEEKVEFIIVKGEDLVVTKKNTGGLQARGGMLVFIDADCTVSPEFFSEISKRSKNPLYIGGGMRYVIPTVPSLGVVCFMFLIALYCKVRSISIGVSCIRKDVFTLLRGFHDCKYHDIDLALRLRRYANLNKKEFQSLKRCKMWWSTRKFEKYGNWHWLFGYHTGV